MRPWLAWRACLLFLVPSVVSCQSGTFLDIKIEGSLGTPPTSLEAKLDNAGQSASVTFGNGQPIGLPTGFVVKLEGERSGDVTVEVSAFAAGLRVAQATGAVSIVPNGVAELRLTLGELPDMAAGVDAEPCPVEMPLRCGGSCVDPSVNIANCGGCGRTCKAPHASVSCVQGACVMGACEAGYAHCTGGPEDGCETQILGKDPKNCGGCGIACKVGQVCDVGVCKENGVDCTTPGVNCRQPGCFVPGRYSISAGGGIVVDLENGRRLWTRMTRGPLKHADADNDCKTLAVEGINGWRLPFYSELSSLQYKTGGLQGCPSCSPAIDQAAFPDTPDGPKAYYMSNDLSPKGYGWQTYFYCDGRGNYGSFEAELYRCVRDPLP